MKSSLAVVTGTEKKMTQFCLILAVCVAGTYAQVSDAELRQISASIWEADSNSLSDNQYSINPSGSTFFTYVDESTFSRPTFRALLNMLDNYIPYTGTPEPNTPEHQREQQEFLDAVLPTGPMQTMWNFLQSKGLASGSESGFKAELSEYWFTLYSRSGGVLDSSGFEHVFAGEIRNGVSGFHNWLQFYLEEQDGSLSYTGDRGRCEPRVSSMSLRWLNNDKSITSIYVATSPEYDFAMYTLCFVTRANGFCPTVTAGNSGNVVTYTMSGVSPRTVGSAYPTC